MSCWVAVLSIDESLLRTHVGVENATRHPVQDVSLDRYLESPKVSHEPCEEPNRKQQGKRHGRRNVQELVDRGHTSRDLIVSRALNAAQSEHNEGRLGCTRLSMPVTGRTSVRRLNSANEFEKCRVCVGHNCRAMRHATMVVMGSMAWGITFLSRPGNAGCCEMTRHRCCRRGWSKGNVRLSLNEALYFSYVRPCIPTTHKVSNKTLSPREAAVPS